MPPLNKAIKLHETNTLSKSIDISTFSKHSETKPGFKIM